MNYNEYGKEQINDICDHIFSEMSTGRSVNKILEEDEGMPSRKTFYRWIRISEEVRNNYAHASKERADCIFEKMLATAEYVENGETVETTVDDDGKVTVKTKKSDMYAHRRLKIDAYKWMLGKMMPKKYGDKIDVTSGDKPLGNAISVTIVPPLNEDD